MGDFKYKLIIGIQNFDRQMDHVGFKPTTFRLQSECSIT